MFWVIDAAWGWHAEGWMVRILGYHDAYASGVIHAIAGGFALGVLGGPRTAHRQVRPRRHAAEPETPATPGSSPSACS